MLKNCCFIDNKLIYSLEYFGETLKSLLKAYDANNYSIFSILNQQYITTLVIFVHYIRVICANKANQVSTYSICHRLTAALHTRSRPCNYNYKASNSYTTHIMCQQFTVDIMATGYNMTKPKIKTIAFNIAVGASRRKWSAGKNRSSDRDRFIYGYIRRSDGLMRDPFRREKSVNFECRNVEIGLSRLRVERTTSFLGSVIASRNAKVKSRKCQRLFISIDGNRSDTHKKIC